MLSGKDILGLSWLRIRWVDVSGEAIVEYCDAQCNKLQEGSSKFDEWSYTLGEWQDKKLEIDQDIADGNA